MTTADSLTRAVGNPKAKSMQYYSAHRKTEHCKYMSRETIAFWAMITQFTKTAKFTIIRKTIDKVYVIYSKGCGEALSKVTRICAILLTAKNRR